MPSSEPYRVGFVLIDGFALLSYAAAMEPLRGANLLAGRELYRWQNLPLEGPRSESSARVAVRADTFTGESTEFDLVLLVAGGDADLLLPPRLVSWLQLLDRRGVQLGGISGGPLLLARAGLMQHESMTVHRDHAHLLATFVPEIEYRPVRHTCSARRLSSAGGTASLDMMLALIARQHGNSLSSRVANWFLHRPDSDVDTAAANSHGSDAFTDKSSLARALEAMETHLADPLTLSQLAGIAGVSGRQLNRLFGQHIGRSCQLHYRQLRIDAAARLLASGQLSVADIARSTGFASSAHFGNRFRESMGESPSEYRKRVNTIGASNH